MTRKSEPIARIACGIFLACLLGATESAAQLSVEPNVNISRLPANQAEVAIAINPTNPSELFAFSNHENIGAGMFAAYSADGGQTWFSSAGPGDAFPSDFLIADGNDQLLPSCCDPTVAWDDFGNLFAAYIDLVYPFTVEIALSLDGGRTFQFLTSLGVGGDQPTIVTGPGSAGAPASIWVTYHDYEAPDPGMVAHGAPIYGFNSVGPFQEPQFLASLGHYGDIAIGPEGQVLVTYQVPDDTEGPAALHVHLDADGLGPGGFGPPIVATMTDVGGIDPIPPQPDRAVDVEVGLAYDRAGCATHGRVYMVYTDEDPPGSDDTDILVRFSDDDGTTWSAPVRVNDDATTNSQFNPRIAVDPLTGDVAVSWHDARSDDGNLGPGDHDGVPNTDVQVFATVSRDGGRTFLPNVQVSDGTSDEDGAEPTPAPFIFDLDYGDYSGLAFFDGSFYPSWADNSNSTGDNPEGTLNRMDIYTARVNVAELVRDTDGDGVCDELDSCPTIPNPDQDPEPCRQEVENLASSFRSPLGHGSGTVSWETSHEVDLVGFNVVVIDRRGRRMQQNADVIPCGPCVGGSGESYVFIIPKHRSGRNIFVEALREGGLVETFGPAVRPMPPHQLDLSSGRVAAPNQPTRSRSR